MRIVKADNIDFEFVEDMNFKFIDNEIRFNVYKVEYSYKTNRGNNKENHRYLIANDFGDARIKFIEYINKENNLKPYRTVLNVKILNTVLIGTVAK